MNRRSGDSVHTHATGRPQSLAPNRCTPAETSARHGTLRTIAMQGSFITSHSTIFKDRRQFVPLATLHHHAVLMNNTGWKRKPQDLSVNVSVDLENAPRLHDIFS